MTKKERTLLAKQLLPHAPGCFVFNNMLILPSQTRFIRAIYLAWSQNRKAVHVEPTLFPTYLPSKNFSLTFGIRISGLWRTDMPDLIGSLGPRIESEALPFLRRYDSYNAFLDYLRPFRTERALEAKYATLVAKEDYSAALTAIEDLHAMVVVQTDWQEEIVKQASEMKAKIVAGAEYAQRLLSQWETFTILNLKLSFLEQSVGN